MPEPEVPQATATCSDATKASLHTRFGRLGALDLSHFVVCDNIWHMEYLADDKLTLLLNKQWLAKNDNIKSIPYLIVRRQLASAFTDTKQVWGEVLSSKLLARRWRDCNPQKSPHITQSEKDEDGWRSQILELLSATHTLGGIIDLSFEVVESRNADLAIELGNEEFKWRWETYYLGSKISADILSQHLIIPLISLTHLAFSSADTVSELSEADLEKAVDKVARTARRSIDTHVKHAVTKPRVATALSRMNAVSNFITDAPNVSTEVSSPVLKVPSMNRPAPLAENSSYSAADLSRDVQDGNSGAVSDNEPPTKSASEKLVSPPIPANDDDSVTEAETDDEPTVPQRSARVDNVSRTSSLPDASGSGSASSRESSSKPNNRKPVPTAQDDSSDTSPVRPSKKKPRVESSSDESEAERSKLVQRKSASSSRGAKQPIKRGGRRF